MEFSGAFSQIRTTWFTLGRSSEKSFLFALRREVVACSLLSGFFRLF